MTKSHPIAERAPSNPLLALARLVLLAGFSLFMLAQHLVFHAFRRTPPARFRHAATGTRSWTGGCALIAGWRATARGPVPPRGSLIAPNHLGYADIMALGSVVPCFFLARADLAGWPLIGWMVSQSEQPIVTRKRGRDVKGSADMMRERLAAGESVCVFLEGTSTGGDRVLPFMPSLVQPAIDTGAPIVPVAIRWKSRDPRVVVSEDVAYWKDHEMGPHGWRLLGLRGLHAEITFGDPIPVTRATDRKELAQQASREVRRMLGVGLTDEENPRPPEIS